MTAKKRFIIFLVIPFLLIASICFYFYEIKGLGDSNPKFTKIEKEKIAKLEKVLKKANGKYYFNGCVLVATNNKIIIDKCYGTADFEKKDTLTTNSIFQLASMSKQFTAMGIMILKDNGKLNYDD